MEVKPGYKQTEVGVIPDDWEVELIGNCVSISVGRDLKEEHYSTFQSDVFQYPVFSNTVANKGVYGFYDFPEHTGESLTIVGRGVGLGTAFKRSGGYGAIGRLLVLVPDKRTDAGFLTEYINHRVQIFSESGGVPQLTGISIAKYRIPLPPTKAEQEAIAEALSDADAFIESLEQFLVKKHQLKRGAMQELLTGKNRLPGFEINPGYKQTAVGVIPEDWEVARLATACSMKSGEGITSTSIDQFSKYPCYGGNGIRGFTTRFTHDGRYALIGRQGALCGNVLGVEGKVFASEHAIVVTASARTDISWLTFILGEMRLNQYSESSAQPGLSVSKLLSLDVAYPPTKAEQTAIATILSDMDAETTALEIKLTKARQIKQGMMQELLTGRIRLVESGKFKVESGA